jgi:hypothetical protein
MRLAVNIIAGSPSRYFRAGEEVPDGAVPPDLAAAYAVAEGAPAAAAEGAAAEALPASEQHEAPGTHVKRGSSWRRVGPDVEMNPGEPTYRRIGKAFVPA